MANDNLHNILLGKGYSPEQHLADRKMVSTGENGKNYILNVSNHKKTVVYQVDGNIICSGNKCDKMILIQDTPDEWTQILVELKGKDINHAILQLESTLKNKLLSHKSNKEKRARIVASSFPSNTGNMTMEKAKIHFMKNYSCELRGMKSN